MEKEKDRILQEESQGDIFQKSTESTFPRETYCFNCGQFVSYTLSEEVRTTNMKRLSFDFRHTTMRCINCGSELYTEFLEEYNDVSLKNAYRRAAHIISVDKVNEIPGKYGIAIRPLSLVLGWGEITFTRFANGAVPTLEYANILQKVYDDPIFYRYMLCKNSDKISPNVFARSLKKVNRIICDLCDDRTIQAVACYLKAKCEVTSLALQKLLYYIQGFYAAEYGTNCFTESCYAWEYGPVYPTVYYLNKLNMLDSKKTPESLIPEELFVIVENVRKYMGSCSGDKLREMTHSETPWMNARSLDPDACPGAVIPFESIKEYFVSVVNSDGARDEIGIEIMNYYNSIPHYLNIDNI